MASMVSHAALGAAAAIAFAPKGAPALFWPVSIICATAQDLDVIGFWLHLPHGHILGHRGFTHSLMFGLGVSLSLTLLLFRDTLAFSRLWFFYVFFFFLLWASHGVLDTFTRGGYGAALLWPFENTRVFSSWAPIPISPIGPRLFFSKWGFRVLMNEFVWVWLPSFSLALFARFLRMLA